MLTTASANYLLCFKEPSDNGPLFTELKFYQRAAKPEQSKEYSTHTYTLEVIAACCVKSRLDHWIDVMMLCYFYFLFHK